MAGRGIRGGWGRGRRGRKGRMGEGGNFSAMHEADAENEQHETIICARW